MSHEATVALAILLCAPCWVAVFWRPARRHMLAFWSMLLLLTMQWYELAAVFAFIAGAYQVGRVRSWR